MSCCLLHLKIVFKGARWDRKAETEKRFFKALIIFHYCRVIDDQTYVGTVKEKKVATQQYLAAVSQVLHLTFDCKAMHRLRHRIFEEEWKRLKKRFFVRRVDN